ncbi:MAG: hypothetical protein LBQ35_01115 [Spirochaetaceae bacterium]|jgi:hypothetical protein|nr:hypothetical protein [Spirochaetaceae bacterium]
MANQDLRDYAIGNIEHQLNNIFGERKMTNKLREQIASDMAVLASNAFRVGYYAKALEDGKTLFTNDFDNDKKSFEYLVDITWRIQIAGK